MIAAQQFKIGKQIIFDLEYWEGEEMKWREVTSEVISLSIDPMGFHPPKCIVSVNGILYGIPFKEIKELIPANGEQLNLF